MEALCAFPRKSARTFDHRRISTLLGIPLLLAGLAMAQDGRKAGMTSAVDSQARNAAAPVQPEGFDA